jgi:hypothetical protein
MRAAIVALLVCLASACVSAQPFAVNGTFAPRLSEVRLSAVETAHAIILRNALPAGRFLSRGGYYCWYVAVSSVW